ncbi:EamA family transporter [Pseudomonas turukhanskensis]|uniref:Membrane protein n=1 Tax=Pseudomonas turukhanskensis TaxID=1806536 RepID=A0A9W6K3U5_9PSED|nr:EamA family transporter [Pseudomonas turukhanskensis]GLK88262.1 membrane protein [Pseudomonas turukhanskensis]
MSVYLVVLLAALLHASWNAIVKGGPNKLLSTVLLTSCAALMGSILLPWLPQPAPASWPFLATSVLLHVAYFGLVARAYDLADMSQTYPIMRGTAPLLVALASLIWLNDPLGLGALLGIVLICLGILTMALARPVGKHSANVRLGLLMALLNAVVIAAYTLVDGIGVRHAGAAAGYTLWLFLLTGVALLAWALAARREAFVAYARSYWRMGVLSAFGTVASYCLVLWAMSQAPVAVVAALRETAILFGMLIASLFLNERLSPTRIAGACVIVAGAVVLRLV